MRGASSVTKRPESAVPHRADELFERHVVPEIPVLLRVAYSLTGQTADAEDLVQDTLVRAYRAIDRFDGEHPRAWLLTILRNTRSNSRRRRRRPHLLREAEARLDHLEKAPIQLYTEESVLDNRFEAALEQALDSLPERHRAVVMLVDVDGPAALHADHCVSLPEGVAGAAGLPRRSASGTFGDKGCSALGVLPALRSGSRGVR